MSIVDVGHAQERARMPLDESFPDGIAITADGATVQYPSK